MVIHGGFWRAEYDRAHTGPLAAALAALGYPVAQLEYRRTGAGAGPRWPATFDDVLAGVAALPRWSPTRRVRAARSPRAADPGRSLRRRPAGALVRGQRPRRRARGVVALAPVADLAEAYRLDLDDGAVAALLGGGPDEAGALRRRRAAVPIAVTDRDPPRCDDGRCRSSSAVA